MFDSQKNGTEREKEEATYMFFLDLLHSCEGVLWVLGSQVGELQHYYVSPGFYLWTQGLCNCVDYAFFLFVGIVEGGGEVMATCFDLWGWGWIVQVIGLYYAGT